MPNRHMAVVAVSGLRGAVAMEKFVCVYCIERTLLLVRSIAVQEAPTSKNTSAIPLHCFFHVDCHFAAFSRFNFSIALIGTK